MNADFLKIVGTSISSIVVLFLMTKLMGNKQMSQLSMFDYINGITIGSIAAEMATALEGDYWQPLTSLVIYGAASFIISILCCKSVKMRRFMNGRALILLEGGKLYHKNLLSARMDVDDLLIQCRNNGYFNLADVETAILETNGKISFLPRSEARPLNPADMSITPEQEKIAANVIMDGKIMEGNLRFTGKDEAWLKKQLHSQGIGSVRDVFLATVDGSDKLSVYVKIDSHMKRNVFN